MRRSSRAATRTRPNLHFRWAESRQTNMRRQLVALLLVARRKRDHRVAPLCAIFRCGHPRYDFGAFRMAVGCRQEAALSSAGRPRPDDGIIVVG